MLILMLLESLFSEFYLTIFNFNVAHNVFKFGGSVSTGYK